jgi:hypothetical protein
MRELKGQCLCGAVRFSAPRESDDFSMCHCQMCRRWAGSAFKSVSVPTTKLEIIGTESVKTRTTSDWGERSFCSECGSTLWYRLTDGPYVGGISIALGLLDDTNGLRLKTEYFVDYKTSADALPEDRKQMTEAEVMALFAPIEGETNDQV